MWFISRFLILLGSVLVALALSSSLTAGEVLLERGPYTAFDAMVEGAISGEDRRLSLVASQLDTVDRLRSVTVPVQLRRGVYARDPSVAAVYPYGRRGLFGLRPSGYIVVRRTPAVVYQQPGILPPAPYASDDRSVYEGSGYSARTAARQPIGHFSGQTGPNRWEYRPLYGDDAEIDVEHAEVESNNPVERDDARLSAPTTNQRPHERQPVERQPSAGSQPSDNRLRASPKNCRRLGRARIAEPRSAARRTSARRVILPR